MAIERVNLDDELKLSGWVEVIDTFIKLGLESPQKLALVPATQLRLALEGHNKDVAAYQLWTAATLLFADLSSDSLLTLKGSSENAEKFLHHLKSAKLCSDAARSGVKKALNLSKIS